MMKKLLALPLFTLIFCCVDPSPREENIACTDEARAGLNVTVKDSMTQNILSAGVTLVAKDGAYEETLQVFDAGAGTFAGAWERSGKYVITAAKPGYRTYTSDTVAVDHDRCHVIGRTLTVLLRPE